MAILKIELDANQFARFWSKVNKGGPLWTDPQTGETSHCWEWTGARTGANYGAFSLTHSQSIGTHRLSWIIAHGELDSDVIICHKCDNPPCCNPSHLLAGTNSENMLDASQKGRMGAWTHPDKILRGEQRSSAKLKESDVLQIRKDFADGVDAISLSEQHGVTRRNIYGIVNRKIWTHI